MFLQLILNAMKSGFRNSDLRNIKGFVMYFVIFLVMSTLVEGLFYFIAIFLFSSFFFLVACHPEY